jgi:large subunit ribosomal protein L35Ae
MKGTIVNYRLSRHVQKTNHMVIIIPSITTRAKASALVGKTAVWKSPKGKEIKGTVASAHGNKGAVRVIFEKGMPGQSLATSVEIQG